MIGLQHLRPNKARGWVGFLYTKVKVNLQRIVIVSSKSKRHSLLGFRRIGTNPSASCEAQSVSKDRYAIGNFQSTSACATLH